MLKHTKFRLALPVLLALGCSLGAASAHAGGVQWSIGINLPAPPMVVYEAAPRVVYAPRPRLVYMSPQVVYAQPRYIERREWCPPHRYREHGNRYGDGYGHRHGDRRGGWEREAYADRY